LEKDLRLSGQIHGAAVSIMSNIAKGFKRGGLGEFHQFLSTAKASSAELRSQLYVALDVGYIDSPTFHDLRTQSEEVRRIVGGLRVSIARQRTKRSPRRE
jgi:four helix bundle protein